MKLERRYSLRQTIIGNLSPPTHDQEANVGGGDTIGGLLNHYLKALKTQTSAGDLVSH